METDANQLPQDDRASGSDSESRTGAGVNARLVWSLIAGVAVVGLVALGVLYFLWKTGRVPGVDNVSVTQEGQIAAYAGAFPAGGAGPLVSPRSVSASGRRLYVTEPDAARITVFDTDGRFIRRFAVTAPGRVYPVDAAAVGETLYIADAVGMRLLAVPVTGGAARRVAPRLKQPTAVAVDADGSLLIADAATGLWRMDVITGQIESAAGPEATRGFAGGIAFGERRIFVSDAGGSRVLDVSIPGGDVAAFGARVNLPRGVAVDSEGRVWVADVFGGTVMVFDKVGDALGDLEDGTVAGADSAEIESPQGVAYSAADRRLFVVDSATGRVLVYTLVR